MTLAAALYEHLKQALVDIVGDRVYPVVARQLGQNEKLQPTVVYMLAGREEKAINLQNNTLTVAVWDFACMAEGYDGAHTLADALIASLNYYKGWMSGGIQIEHAILRDASDHELSEPGFFTVFVQFEIAYQ